ncbi:hypothetical protein HPB50_012072 [Hyalomma asiaticum]|uniref:Uncharacterized protein n=1 Tax=Hyalomma asiaticum TaxID=266040 RepID=A0ACB7RWZ0_HYAAI|nr:hypothetical protein HPB50_012072 [Hyalomma asiaticum]
MPEPPVLQELTHHHNRNRGTRAHTHTLHRRIHLLQDGISREVRGQVDGHNQDGIAGVGTGVDGGVRRVVSERRSTHGMREDVGVDVPNQAHAAVLAPASTPGEGARVVSGVVPSKFPSCPAYLSKECARRESPDSRRERLEVAAVQAALAESAETSRREQEADTVQHISDIASHIRSRKSTFWHCIESGERLLPFHIVEDEAPSIKYSLVLKSDLTTTFHFMKRPTNKLGRNLCVPPTASSKKVVTEFLDSVEAWDTNVAYSPTKRHTDDIVEAISFLLSKLSTPTEEDNGHATQFLTEQLKLLSTNKTRISDLDERQRAVTLMLDEIHIKPFFDYKGGNIAGMNSPEAATSAMRATSERRMLSASFGTIVDMYNIEVGQLLRHAYTLSRKALFPTDIEKQNVKVALQVLNETVPPALREIGNKHNLYHVEGTAMFIEIIAKWWKVVNVKTPSKGARLRDEFQDPVFSVEDRKIDFLYNFLDWMEEWKKRTKDCDSGTLTKKTHAGLHQTTQGLIEIVRYCLDELKLSCVLLGKIQTDCLEDRFVLEQLSKQEVFLKLSNQRQVATDLTVELLSNDESSEFDACDDGHSCELVLKMNDKILETHSKSKKRKLETLSKK